MGFNSGFKGLMVSSLEFTCDSLLLLKLHRPLLLPPQGPSVGSAIDNDLSHK